MDEIKISGRDNLSKGENGKLHYAQFQPTIDQKLDKFEIEIGKVTSYFEIQFVNFKANGISDLKQVPYLSCECFRFDLATKEICDL